MFCCLRLLEQELQVWRLAVQSEHGLLEDRCSEMEVTMEALRQHHLRLQGMLTQVNLPKNVFHIYIYQISLTQVEVLKTIKKDVLYYILNLNLNVCKFYSNL